MYHTSVENYLSWPKKKVELENELADLAKWLKVTRGKGVDEEVLQEIMRTGQSEFLRYHYGGNDCESNPATQTELEILRSDIERLHIKIDHLTKLVTEIKR